MEDTVADYLPAIYIVLNEIFVNMIAHTFPHDYNTWIKVLCGIVATTLFGMKTSGTAD